MPQETRTTFSILTCLYRFCGKTQCVLFNLGGRSLWRTSQLGLVHAFNMDSMKQVRAMLLNKIT